MLLKMLKAKIQPARVTEANLHYEGSITIGEDLLEVSGMLPFEKVHVLNLANGTRAETYIIKGERGSGEIIMNGAIAHLVKVDDTVIVLSYCLIEEEEAKNHRPTIVLLDDQNRVRKIIK